MIFFQINEMVYIEDGGEKQIVEEINAYKSLIPNGKELIVTFMVEIDNPVKRTEVLKNLGGVEQKISIDLGTKTILGKAELDVDRTTIDGKASSVQFIHFNFDDTDISLFKNESTKVKIEIGHEYYQHSTTLRGEVKGELQKDFMDQ